MANAVNFDKVTLAWTLPWDTDWVTAVCFLGATRRLAAGNNRGQILLWDLPERPGEKAPTPTQMLGLPISIEGLGGHTNAVTRLVSTADGRCVISASYDHTIRYWFSGWGGATIWKVPITLNARTRQEAAARSSRKVPDALQAKVAFHKSDRVLEGHHDWVQALALSRDGSLLVSGDDGGQVIVWDRPAGKELRRWRLKGWAYALALSPDNKQAAISERIPLVFDPGQHTGVKLWDVAAGRVQRDLGADFKGMYLSAAAYSPDGKLLALGRGGEVDGPNGKVFLLDPASGKKLRELAPGHQYGVTGLAFHPGGGYLASCGRDTMVRVWSAADGKLVKELGKSRGGQFKDWIHAISFSADGRWLAAADMAGAVQVWSIPG
jgi:WD40 repeat protein